MTTTAPTETIETRKADHIDIVLNQNVNAKGVTTGFERYFFEHNALPELDLDEIDTSVTLFGKRLNAPLLISSMTGGAQAAQATSEQSVASWVLAGVTEAAVESGLELDPDFDLGVGIAEGTAQIEVARIDVAQVEQIEVAQI